MERDGIYPELASQRSPLREEGNKNATYDTIWKPHRLEDVRVEIDDESREHGMQEDGQQYLCVDCPFDEAKD